MLTPISHDFQVGMEVLSQRFSFHVYHGQCKHLSKMNSVQVDFLRITFHTKSSHFFTNETLSYMPVYILPFMVILSFLQIEMSVLTFWKSSDFYRFASGADGQCLSHCAYTQLSCEKTYLPAIFNLVYKQHSAA